MRLRNWLPTHNTFRLLINFHFGHLNMHLMQEPNRKRVIYKCKTLVLPYFTEEKNAQGKYRSCLWVYTLPLLQDIIAALLVLCTELKKIKNER